MNVTERTDSIFYFGFILEALIVIIAIIGLFIGGKVPCCSDFLGAISLGWFIWLLSYRYDHYGKVCLGDYELKPNPNDVTTFKNLELSGVFIQYYALILCGIASLIFLGVICYTCVADPMERPIHEEESGEFEMGDMK